LVLVGAELDATSGIVNMPCGYRDLRGVTMLAVVFVCDTTGNRYWEDAMGRWLPIGSSPQAFDAKIHADYAKWGPIIQAAGIKAE
jgi:hypothetical protein